MKNKRMQFLITGVCIWGIAACGALVMSTQPQKEEYLIQTEQEKLSGPECIKQGDFSFLQNDQELIEELERLYTQIWADELARGVLEWVERDLNGDGSTDLILRDGKSASDMGESPKSIQIIFSCAPDDVKCVETDFNDSTEFSFLSETGKLIYYAPSSGRYRWRGYQYFEYEEDWTKNRISLLETWYIDNINPVDFSEEELVVLDEEWKEKFGVAFGLGTFYGILKYDSGEQSEGEFKALTKEEFDKEFNDLTGWKFSWTGDEKKEENDVDPELGGCIRDDTGFSLYYDRSESLDYPYSYRIYGMDGSVMIQEEDAFRRFHDPLIKMVTDEIVHVGIYMERNVFCEWFYDRTTGEKSEEFWNIEAVDGRMIAYMELQDDGGYCLVVRDIFDPSRYYKIIERDFSTLEEPSSVVYDAAFLKDGRLKFIYYAGEERERTEEVVELYDMEKKKNMLDEWIGTYKFLESARHAAAPDLFDFWSYSIEIYREQREYYAALDFTGHLLWIEGRAKVCGNEERIDLIFEQYSLGYVSSTAYFDEGDLLLSFEKEGEKLLTFWGEMKPALLQNESDGNIYFIKESLG